VKEENILFAVVDYELNVQVFIALGLNIALVPSGDNTVFNVHAKH